MFCCQTSPLNRPKHYLIHSFSFLSLIPFVVCFFSFPSAGVARYLLSQGLAPNRYVASQGANLGRSGKIYVNKADEKDEDGEDIVWIGGDVVTCIDGQALI